MTIIPFYLCTTIILYLFHHTIVASLTQFANSTSSPRHQKREIYIVFIQSRKGHLRSTIIFIESDKPPIYPDLVIFIESRRSVSKGQERGHCRCIRASLSTEKFQKSRFHNSKSVSCVSREKRRAPKTTMAATTRSISGFPQQDTDRVKQISQIQQSGKRRQRKVYPSQPLHRWKLVILLFPFLFWDKIISQ